MILIVKLILTLGLSWLFTLFFMFWGWVMAFGAIIGIAGITFFYTKDKISIVPVLFLWVTAYGLLINLTFLGNVRALNFVDDVLVMLLVLRVVLALPFRVVLAPIKMFFLLWVLFFLHVVISGVVNHTEPVAILNFISSYSKLMVVFMYLLIYFDDKSLKRLLILIFIIMAVQFVVANIQFFSYNHGNFLIGRELRAGHGAGWEDSARGFFGQWGAHKLGHFSLILVIISFSLWIFTQKRKWLAWGVVSFFTFFISYTQQDYIVVVLYFISALNTWLKLRLRMMVRPLIIFIVIFIGIFGVLKLQHSDSLTSRRFFEYFSDTRKLSNIGKVQALQLVGKIYTENPEYAFIGAGPGSIKGGGEENERAGKLFLKYSLDRIALQVTSTLDFWWSSFITLVVEIGVTGYVIFWIPYFILYRMALRVYKCSDPRVSTFERGLAFALCHIVFLLVFITFMSNHFEWFSITFPFAIIAAMVWRAHQKIVLPREVV